MSTAAGFLLGAGLLLAVVLFILLRPLLRAPAQTAGVGAQQLNVGIFRDQLRELERECAAGTLADADFREARDELQRRLLEENRATGEVVEKSGGRRTAFVLLFAIPLAALAGYALLGTPQAFDPDASRPHVAAEQIAQMVDGLAARLKANPDDTKGWIMLARSYKALGRYAEAAGAYAHAGAVVENEPALLADYAEMLARANGGAMAGKPEELVNRALKLDPGEPQALFLAGAAATERNDFKAVIDYWGRLLPQLEPGSDEARSLQTAVDKARDLAARGDVPGAMSATPEVQKAVRSEAISGEVMLAGAIAAKAQPDDVLFVFARPDDGSRMPLAVMRGRVADLPLKFSLDDTQALPGGGKISGFKSVTIEARVAKSGQAQSASGDLFGVVKGVGIGTGGVRVTIDQVRP